jgi:hypothetical protein
MQCPAASHVKQKFQIVEGYDTVMCRWLLASSCCQSPSFLPLLPPPALLLLLPLLLLPLFLTLQVPTTRALCCVGTGDGVYRDMFYNGNVKLEPGAVVCRMAPSFVRFGTFQLPVSRGGLQTDLVKVLLDYVINTHYKHLLEGKRQLHHCYRVLARCWRSGSAWCG